MARFAFFAASVQFVLAVCASASPTPGSLLRRDSVEETLEYLKNSGKKLHNTGLMQFAGRLEAGYMGPDQFEKVKDLINHMITQKLTEQSKDTSRNAFCQQETGKSDKNIAKLQKEIERGQADADLKEAKIEQMKENMADMSEDVASLEKKSIEKTSQRNAEKAEYEKERATFDTPPAFLQKHLHRRQEPSAAEREHEREKIERRIEAEQKERDAAFHYDSTMKKMEDDKIMKKAAIKQTESDQIFANRDLFETKRDLQLTKDQLASAQDYSEKLKRDCMVREEPKEERKRRRSEMIDSLKEAHQILTGEGIPVDLN